MSNAPSSVTCSERARMNAVAGLLFVLAGDAIILYAVLGDKSGTFGSVITGVCGGIGVCFGLYYMSCYLNRKITVTDDGVYYTNWLGKTSAYSWDDVTVEHQIGRNAKFIFYLKGKKVSFYGYANNAEQLHQWLLEHERYDADTMRIERELAEQQKERIRQMQRRAQSHVAPDTDDDIVC